MVYHLSTAPNNKYNLTRGVQKSYWWLHLLLGFQSNPNLFLACQPSLAKTKRGNLFFKRGIVLSGPERFTNVVLSSIWNKNYAAENSHLDDILILLS